MGHTTFDCTIFLTTLVHIDQTFASYITNIDSVIEFYKK